MQDTIIVSPVTIESKLRKMSELRDKIKELTAHKDMLEEELIIEHFCRNIEYRNEFGLLMATYTPVKSTRFQQSQFKEVHPTLYVQFEKETISNRFLLRI